MVCVSVSVCVCFLVLPSDRRGKKGTNPPPSSSGSYSSKSKRLHAKAIRPAMHVASTVNVSLFGIYVTYEIYILFRFCAIIVYGCDSIVCCFIPSSHRNVWLFSDVYCSFVVIIISTTLMFLWLFTTTQMPQNVVANGFLSPIWSSGDVKYRTTVPG